MPANRIGLVILVFLAACLASVGHAFARPGTDNDNGRGALSIQVADGDWGNARRADVEQVLMSAAHELQVFFPNRSGDTIRVEHADRAPKVLYERGANGEYVILLTASGRRWAEYAYEFGHELCHIYANYQLRQNTAAAVHQWFEESLCETASLFVLHRMAASWETHPPYAQWRDYAPAFAEYAQALLGEPHRHGETVLGPWYAQHAAMLSRNPYSRQDNEYCATRLLGLFESQPEGWGALQYLNTPTAAELSFRSYLQHWHDATPAVQRPFLAKLLALFGVAPEAQRLAAAH